MTKISQLVVAASILLSGNPALAQTTIIVKATTTECKVEKELRDFTNEFRVLIVQKDGQTITYTGPWSTLEASVRNTVAACDSFFRFAADSNSHVSIDLTKSPGEVGFLSVVDATFHLPSVLDRLNSLESRIQALEKR